MTINCIWEPQPIEWIEAKVVDQRATRSSRYGTKYYVELAPWNSTAEAGAKAGEVEVESSEFKTAEASGVICIALRPGSLGIPWFSIHPCELSPETR